MTIGKIEKVPLRNMWENEAHNFTPWLADNIDILGDAIGMNLSFIEREKKNGSFSLDILAEDNSGNKVIIENQLEKSDHDHLGKLLTYLTGLEAKTAIWVCSEARQEHIQVIEWLNENTYDGIQFYLVRLEGLKIGESIPAPYFSVVCAPSEIAKDIGREKEEDSKRHKLRLEFWELLLAKSKVQTQLHGNISPSRDNWISAGAGKSGLSYTYSITMNSASVEFSIDGGKDAEELNKQRFNELYQHKDVIENSFGEALIWDCVEGRKSCRIKLELNKYGLKDKDNWDTLQTNMIDAMIRLEKAMCDEIKMLTK
ncbi:DUF4268 domain-containing protein [Methanococcoides seepicolus]|jgi:hypothetical protein|uniref:DUF4268 domain-containing protein n=1 Tax=Methanococcoides seepicolus TaxID=2828780 RepID=A0A9E4ZGW4_9EURY|nr:DUF4268 domain-containing protein [Methanococcoides seepicolus]MCM1986948.1 DUF4268 domain-containing protein [Methanococcoides seepicolus]